MVKVDCCGVIWVVVRVDIDDTDASPIPTVDAMICGAGDGVCVGCRPSLGTEQVRNKTLGLAGGSNAGGLA